MQPIKILIVDDSAIVRAVISKSLAVAGYETCELFEAANGKEAIELLSNTWIDLIFTDINMPVMNGVEMIEKLSEDGLLQTIPVVVISTEGSQTRVEQLKSKGVRAYLRKPFTPEMIRNVMDEIIGAA